MAECYRCKGKGYVSYTYNAGTLEVTCSMCEGSGEGTSIYVVRAGLILSGLLFIIALGLSSAVLIGLLSALAAS